MLNKTKMLHDAQCSFHWPRKHILTDQLEWMWLPKYFGRRLLTLKMMTWWILLHISAKILLIK